MLIFEIMLQNIRVIQLIENQGGVVQNFQEAAAAKEAERYFF